MGNQYTKSTEFSFGRTVSMETIAHQWLRVEITQRSRHRQSIYKIINKSMENSAADNHQNMAQTQGDSKYKSQLCRHYQSTISLYIPLENTCQLNDKCIFAHGVQELQQLSSKDNSYNNSPVDYEEFTQDLQCLIKDQKGSSRKKKKQTKGNKQ